MAVLESRTTKFNRIVLLVSVINQKKIYCFHCIRMAYKYRNPIGPLRPDPDKGDVTSGFSRET